MEVRLPRDSFHSDLRMEPTFGCVRSERYTRPAMSWPEDVSPKRGGDGDRCSLCHRSRRRHDAEGDSRRPLERSSDPAKGADPIKALKLRTDRRNRTTFPFRTVKTMTQSDEKGRCVGFTFPA
jgi:hypothetical protein